MFEKKEEGQESTGQSETVVGASVKLEGDLVSDGDVFVHGNVTGKVNTKADLNIGDTAMVNADVRAKNVIVAGKVEGNINADGKVEIATTGQVNGDIKTDDLLIASGAKFSGSCQMEGQEASEAPPSEPKKKPQE